MQLKIGGAGLSLLLSLSLSLEPINDKPAQAQKVRIGCQQTFSTEYQPQSIADQLQALPIGASLTDLFRIAASNCILVQTFKAQGVPKFTRFAYAFKSWRRCYLQVDVTDSKVSRIQKVCI
jgi:hypothetical protein